MSKAKITVTFEYEMNPEWYEDDATPEDMVANEVSNYEADFGALLEVMSGHEVTIKGEVVEEPK